jgi:hypothetical protein
MESQPGRSFISFTEETLGPPAKPTLNCECRQDAVRIQISRISPDFFIAIGFGLSKESRRVGMDIKRKNAK